jgi:hypothetical protein
LATLLAALSGFLLLLTRLLLPAAALLAALTALLPTLMLAALTALLAALAWILISHDFSFLLWENSRKGQRSSHRYVPFPEKRLDLSLRKDWRSLRGKALYLV